MCKLKIPEYLFQIYEISERNGFQLGFMTEAFEEKRINDSSFQRFLLFKIAWLEIF